jgi:hypothetical protein
MAKFSKGNVMQWPGTKIASPDEQAAPSASAWPGRKVDALEAETQPEAEGNRGGLAFLNRGISNVLGAPVDLVNAGLGAVGLPTSERPFLGSEMIADGLGVAGVRTSDRGAKPDTMGEYIGRGVGEAAGALLPMAGVSRGLQAAQGPVKQGIGNVMMQPFINTPRRALAAEIGAGAGAGVGAATADQLSDGDSRWQVPAEIAGAVVGGMGVSGAMRAAEALPLTGLAIRTAKKTAAPFTRAGAMERARDRVRDLAEDPAAARQTLIDEPILRDPDTGEAMMSPAQRTGDRRLMALEQAVRDTDPPLDLAMRQNETQVDEALREMLRAPAEGRNIQDATAFISDRFQRLQTNLDAQIANAGARAQKKVEALAPGRTASEASIVVRQELDNALRVARQEERKLWQAIPQNEVVPTQAARNAYARIRADTSRAQLDDIPEKARRFLDPDSSNSAFGQTETIKEVHGLYSAMREQSRAARAAGERNTARIADEIADALLEDLGSLSARNADQATPTGRMITEAREYSRMLNERFHRGSVGRILGHAREGGASMPAELTLEGTLGRGGVRGAVSADELRLAVGGSADAESAAQDYLARKFSEHAVRNGTFSQARAQDFLTKNAEMLDRFPALKARMMDAEQAQALASRTSDRLGGRAQSLRDPSRSIAAGFLNAPVDQEIQTILRARDPRAAATQLRRQASKDPSGDAVRGLKGGFLDHLMQRAKGGGFTEDGAEYLSGRAILKALDDPKIAAASRGMLEPQEVGRLRMIAQELAKAETARGRLPSIGPVMDASPNKLIAYFARVFAARSGAQLGQGTSGASLQTAGMASNRMKRLLESLTNDRAEALIREAITDPELFRTLLAPGGPTTKRAENRLIETLTAIGGGQVSRASEATIEE